MVNLMPQEIITRRKLSLSQLLFVGRASGQWDALAYDKVSASPATTTVRETLGKDRVAPKAPGNPPVGTNIPALPMHVKFMLSNGRVGKPHPQLSRADWLKANSRNGLLLPTGLVCGAVCGKCMFRDCKCPKPTP